LPVSRHRRLDPDHKQLILPLRRAKTRWMRSFLPPFSLDSDASSQTSRRVNRHV
jgi:hypothetical protein